MDKTAILAEIKSFLDGRNNDLKYLVNVETDSSSNLAECVIHAPGEEPKIIEMRYEPFMYVKDLNKLEIKLYEGHSQIYRDSMAVKYGITIKKLKTGNQKRLLEGYCYKVTSSKSFNSIVNYFNDGGFNPYEKEVDEKGKWKRDKKGKLIYKYRDLFYSPKPVEQFFISTGIRLYKGYEEYKNVHKVTFDIETTGLRYQTARVFAIGVRDNRGFEIILEVDKINDNESEIRLIQDFFNLIHLLNPAVISGYFSETFDFDFILGRAKILEMDLSQVPTSLKKDVPLKRRADVSVKYGNTAEKYTATEMWGISVIDILHAVRRTAAVNSDIKETGLKYIAKFEKVARPNRTYIDGEDNSIGRFYYENKIFLIDEFNNYMQIPENHQETAKKFLALQYNKKKVTEQQYNSLRNQCLKENPGFVTWFREEALPKKLTKFIGGKNLVKQYLLDDLWETEQVDELYNQSSFMMAKIIPTTYQRVCTMGTASIWNLLMTAWSYENDIAIPVCDKKLKFSGGLARCYKSGYTKRLIKIDYASLYPSIQLSEGVFPIFDITGVMKKMLLYLTTTRNIYKKLANNTELNNEEMTLLRQIDPLFHVKYINKELTVADRAMCKIKQLPVKILNNSMFGALGSGMSFNWSDNVCAARITCTGRLHLRHAIHWFNDYGCIALLAVTDGINFHFPEKTKIRITDEGVTMAENEQPIEEMWQYGGKTGIHALIEKYNKEEMKPPYMSVDEDGESIACLNLSRINYATLSVSKDKKTGELKEKVKLTGNTIKSKVMPEYIEDFIDKALKMILQGKSKEFIDYYYDYANDIRYMQIPLKKIASKSKIKNTFTAYKKRGKDKNGRQKGMQAHMELLIEKREQIARELYEKHKDEFILEKVKEVNDIDTIMKLVANYMPPEPELDSMVYYVNCGYKKSHGDSRKIKDKVTGNERFVAKLIDNENLLNNPNLTGEYNYEKYLDAFNKRVMTLLAGFDPEIRKKILVKINKQGDLMGSKDNFVSNNLALLNFDLDDFNESMHLEKLEVEFWNKTGYDPRLIWNGFKMYDDDEHVVYYEIYENALNYLNDLMTKSNKPRIKSINSQYENGDLVLIKDGSEYRVGAFNGTCIQIIRPIVEVPKSELELELDRRREERERKLQELKASELAAKKENGDDPDSEKNHQEMLVKQAIFEDFKNDFSIPERYTLDELIKTEPDAEEMFNYYFKQKKRELVGDPDEDNEDGGEGDDDGDDGDSAY
jgi:DNA polymerase elongation subunit (family B)